MLINFCNNKLVTSITCSAGECDGYEVTNLISDKEFQRKKGLLVDYFIKPPITVEINFVCEINIDQVVIWPRVGNQKTSGIEILTSCCGNVFNSIASGTLKNDELGFVFCKYNGDIKLKIPDNFLTRSFKSGRFLRAKSLQIRIFRTYASSVPALQGLEIWGKPCRDCSKDTVDMVMNIWSKVNKCKEENNVQNRLDSTVIKIGCSSEPPVVSSQLQIPDEFIDSITNEIMIAPMILPSGNIIDNTTLEKYIKEESKWGRLPSDPFTGKLFTTKSSPKISVDLKARIDKFLVNNCNEPCITTMARTVGSCKTTVGPRISSLVSCNGSSFSYTTDVQVNEQAVISDSLCINKNKRKLCSEAARSIDNNTDNAKSNAKHSKTLHNSLLLKKCFTDSSCYDRLKEQSLDSVLKTTLSNLPSFTNEKSVTNKISIICCKCASNSNLYQLPCKHHICRSCLCFVIETNLCKCSSCSEPFVTSDPKKIYIS